MVKVLLTQPMEDIRNKRLSENPSTPLGLVYIGTAIEDQHSVKIFDRNLNIEDSDFMNLLERYNPDIIGFNSLTSEMLFDIIHLSKLIKKNFPEKTIVVGGIHATVEPNSLLDKPYIDYIIKGEGEGAFLEFCNVFEKDKNKLKNLENINHNPLRPYLDLNNLKVPNYNLLEMKKYKKFFININRGCPGTCTFCYNVKQWGENNHPYMRTLSVGNTIKIFKSMIEEHGIKNFMIVDDTFLTFKKNVLEVCKYLEKKNVSFYCLGRADFIDDEILKALKKAGCDLLQAGVESGSQRVLDFLSKNVTIEKNKEYINLCKKNKINSDASFMIGITTETMDELKETEKFINETKPDIINLKIFNPLPGTKLFDYCIENKLIEKPKTLEDWAGWMGIGSMWDIQHNTSKIPDKDLMDMARKLWGKRFYRTKIKRFIYYMRRGDFKFLVKGIKGLFITRRQIKIPGVGFVFKEKK